MPVGENDQADGVSGAQNGFTPGGSINRIRSGSNQMRANEFAISCKTWIYLLIIPPLAIPAGWFVITIAPARVEGREVKQRRHQTAGNY
jgi:hypothetical protein